MPRPHTLHHYGPQGAINWGDRHAPRPVTELNTAPEFLHNNKPLSAKNAVIFTLGRLNPGNAIAFRNMEEPELIRRWNATLESFPQMVTPESNPPIPNPEYTGERKRRAPRAESTDNPPPPAPVDLDSVVESVVERMRESIVTRDTLDSMLASAVRPHIESAVRDVATAAAREAVSAALVPFRVEIRRPDGTTHTTGAMHRNFATLLQMVAAGVNVWLHGPAGTGKTTAAEKTAEALKLPFYFTGAIDSEHKLLGFIDAHGKIVSKPFRQAFEHGGVFLFDEIDSSFPGALLAFNACLANGTADFPDRNVKRHKDFRVIAAANTIGAGASVQYSGRMRQDAALTDRFTYLDWPVDEALESVLFGGTPERDRWVSRVQQIRARVAAKGIQTVISPRASARGAALLAAGLAWTDVERAEFADRLGPQNWESVR